MAEQKTEQKPEQKEAVKVPRGVFKDAGSILRSEPYSDLYSTIRAPLATNHPKGRVTPLPLAPIKSKETLQQRLMRRTMSRFKANNFTLPGLKLHLIGKLAKYLFLAIAAPLYLLCAKIPRYLSQQGIPAVAKLLRKLSQWNSTTLSDLAGWSGQKVLNLFRKASGKKLKWEGAKFSGVTQEFRDLTRDLSKQASVGTSRLFQRMLFRPRRMLQRAVEVAKLPGLKIKKGIDSVKETIQRYRQKVNAFGARINARYDKAVKAVAALIGRLVRPIIAWVQPKIQFVVRKAQAIQAWVAAKVEKYSAIVKRWLQPIVTPISRALKSGSAWYSAKMETLKELPYKYRWDPVKTAQAAAQKITGEYWVATKERAVRAWGLLKRAVSKTYDTLKFSKSGLKAFGSGLATVFNVLFHLMPDTFHRWVVPVFRLVGRSVIGVFLIASSIALALWKGVLKVGRIFEVAKAAGQLLADRINILGDAIKKRCDQLAQIIIRPLKGVASRIRWLTRKASHTFRVTMAWASVLLHYGLQQVKLTLDGQE